jgi:hypothetical protein
MLSCFLHHHQALTDDKGRSHVPYRDSKLTRVLQDSLVRIEEESSLHDVKLMQLCIFSIWYASESRPVSLMNSRHFYWKIFTAMEPLPHLSPKQSYVLDYAYD